MMCWCVSSWGGYRNAAPDDFSSAIVIGGAAAGRAPGDHSLDPSLPAPAGAVGGDDVSARGATHEQRAFALAASADFGAAGAGDRADYFCDHASAGGRLAEADGGR